MSHTRPHETADVAEPEKPYHVQPTAMSAWVGWIAFAAVCLSLLGSFHVVQGVAALVDGDYFPVVGHGPVTDLSLTAWGWVHLLGGAVLIVAGLCVFAGQVWARTVGVLVAAASLVTSFAFLGAYPALSLVMIALGVVVILALTVHGSDIKP